MPHAHAAALPLAELYELYASHHGWLHAWLRRKLGCAEQAADLAQDTFLRVMTSRQAADAANSAGWNEPRAYLTTVARHLMADHWRRQELERSYLNALACLPEAQTPSPETRQLILETLTRIDRCLTDLPPLTRRIFLRSQLDGCIYGDIAREMQISLATVKRHMSRAFLACLCVA